MQKKVWAAGSPLSEWWNKVWAFEESLRRRCGLQAAHWASADSDHLHCMSCGSSFAGLPRCAFTLTRNVAAPAVVLFQSSSIASSKKSASGAPTNFDFSPSHTYLFIAFSSACLSHKYSKGFVTGVPRNAKTKAASSGRFGLNRPELVPGGSGWS